MLMMSPEVVAEYRRRYAGVPSVIASSMAGRPIVRPADLCDGGDAVARILHRGHRDHRASPAGARVPLLRAMSKIISWHGVARAITKAKSCSYSFATGMAAHEPAV